MAPMFKKGLRYIPANYIPFRSIVCNLLEGIIRDYIQDFRNENSIISSMQHGFMKTHSYQTNLLTFYEELSCKIEQQARTNDKATTTKTVY